MARQLRDETLFSVISTSFCPHRHLFWQENSLLLIPTRYCFASPHALASWCCMCIPAIGTRTHAHASYRSLDLFSHRLFSGLSNNRSRSIFFMERPGSSQRERVCRRCRSQDGHMIGLLVRCYPGPGRPGCGLPLLPGCERRACIAPLLPRPPGRVPYLLPGHGHEIPMDIGRALSHAARCVQLGGRGPSTLLRLRVFTEDLRG